MRSANGWLELDAEIRRAEVALQDRRHRVARDWRQMRAGASSAARSKVMLIAGAVAGGWLLLRARRPRVLAPPRSSAKMAAFVAPLVSRLLAPTLGRETATLLASVAVPFVFSGRPTPPQTVPAVRLRDYAGHWYEIARLGAPFERRCAGDASAHYALRRDGRIDVTNRCRTRRGRLLEAVGEARPVHGSANSRLKVSFAPRWLRWLPFVWANYWVLDLMPDYSAALVGTPDRGSLWLLGRAPQIAQPTLERLLARAAAQGFDIGALKFTEQHPEAAAARRPTARRR